MIRRPFLFDATRTIATSWAGKSPTGIDRVCHAYLRHFGASAQAVVQHRGVFRILGTRHSDELFDMLGNASGATRLQIAAFALRAWGEGRPRGDGSGAIYLNVGHTDFDLPGHARWVRECRLRPVYFLHDLIPITHPQYCRPRAVARHRGRVVNALKTATGIIVSSQSTARELMDFAQQHALPLPPLAVAPLAADRRDEPARPVARDRPYFLCLGTIEARKNHCLLLDVWLRLIVQSGVDAPRLVIVGQWGARSETVRKTLNRHPALHRYVTLITRSSDDEVRSWMAGARALLMPTLAEGFGLPLVEALVAGTPVIASDLPCFHENGEGIPCLLDPADPAAWARAIAGFCEPGGERQRQRQRLGRYRPPVWEDHFATIEGWLATFRASSDRLGTASDPRSPQDAASGMAAAAMTRHPAIFQGSFRTIEAGS